MGGTPAPALTHTSNYPIIRMSSFFRTNSASEGILINVLGINDETIIHMACWGGTFRWIDSSGWNNTGVSCANDTWYWIYGEFDNVNYKANIKWYDENKTNLLTSVNSVNYYTSTVARKYKLDAYYGASDHQAYFDDASFDIAYPFDYLLVAEAVAPSIEEILICQSSSCSYQKSLDPATQFTVKIKATGDLNVSDFDLNILSQTKENAWDFIELKNVDGNSADSDGCIRGSDYYCLKVNSLDWTIKFKSGNTDVNVIGYNNGRTQSDSNASLNSISVNQTTGITADATSGTYSGQPNTTANAILTNLANNYILITHNGNADLNTNVQCTDLTKGGDTIDKSNEKFNNFNVYLTSTACDGTAQIFLSNWTRGTYPTSNSQNHYLWLDMPNNTPVGNYTGTLTYNSVAS